jgi:hypothetical protein
MSQTAPPSDKSGKRASSSLVPPDERFWQRYSPHAEFPLSSAGSFVLHVLALGLLGLMAWLATTLFDHASRQLPVEAVRLAGGGGNPRGQGDGANTGAPVEVGEKPNEAVADNVPPEDVAPPKIEVNPNSLPKTQFDDSTRQIQKIDDASRAFARLGQRANKIQLPSSEPPGYGKGGTGKGGGSGSGEGEGYGSGKGEGLVNPTQREKRAIRWTMGFNTVDMADYVAQLRGVGAILAIPIGEKGDDFDYGIIRNLSARPAKLQQEDIQKVLQEVHGMIRWYENDPKNAAGVLAVLGIPLPKISPEKLHFVACMPAKLEQKLSQLELAYLNRKFPGRNEDDIHSTKFRIKVLRSGKYEPEVVELKLK